MSPVESLMEDARPYVGGKSDRTIRSYIKGLRDLGLAFVDGRCIDLVPPSDVTSPAADGTAGERRKPSGRRPKVADDRQSTTGEELPESGGKLPVVGGILPVVGDNQPNQLTPPCPPNSSPDPQPRGSMNVQLALVVAEPDKSEPPPKRHRKGDGLGSAEIRTWWESVYLPLRANTHSRWRGKPVRGLLCGDERIVEIQAALKSVGVPGPWDAQRDALTHVVICAAAKVDAQRGAHVPYKGKTYDTMKNIEPKYWLAHFQDLLDMEPPVADVPPVVPRRVAAFNPDEEVARAIEASDYEDLAEVAE